MKQYMAFLILSLLFNFDAYASCEDDYSGMIEQIGAYNSILAVDGKHRLYWVYNVRTGIIFCTANASSIGRHGCKRVRWRVNNWGHTLTCYQY